MRRLRLALFFIIGLALCVTVTLSHAETTPAIYAKTAITVKYANSYSASYIYDSAPGACTVLSSSGIYTSNGNSAPTSPTSGTIVGTCKVSASTYNIIANSVCPSGSAWSSAQSSCVSNTLSCPDSSWTLSGSTCTRPDACPMAPTSGAWLNNQPTTQPSTCNCPTNYKWMPGQGCRKTCGTGMGADPGQAAWGDPTLFYPKGQSEGCYGGCGVQPNSAEYTEDGKGGRWYSKSTYTGWSCGTNPTTTADDTEAPKLDPGKKHPPLCGATEGVLTDSNGKVNCLPEGVPDTRVPKVDKTKVTETSPDGAKKTTETTKTVDPGTGASDTQVTTTTCDSTGACSAPSTSSTSASKSGSGTGGEDEAGCDPQLKMCGKPSTSDLYKKKDKTVDTVLTDFKNDISNTDFAKGAGSFFKVSIPGGSCSGLSTNVPYLNVTIDLGQYICSPQAQQMMETAGAVLRLVVAYVAFTWAFL